MEDSKNRENLSIKLGIDPNVGKNLDTLNLTELNNLKQYYQEKLPNAPIDQYSDFAFAGIYGTRDQIKEYITNINNKILEKSKGGKKRKPKTKKFKKRKRKTKKF